MAKINKDMTIQYDFKDNKYTRWYYTIINNRKINTPPESSYTESHHIIPRSFFINTDNEYKKGWLPGNPDVSHNTILLTGREHALCHWLLTKMVEYDSQAYHLMTLSFNMMGVKGEHQGRSFTRMITRAYERNKSEAMRSLSTVLKEQYANGRETWNKGKKLEDEKYRKGGRKNKGLKRSDETRQLIAASKIGKKQSEETSEKKRQKMLGFVRGPQSPEHTQRIKETCGGPKKEGHGENVAAAVVGNISINKDGKEKRVKEHQLQSFLDDGWALGGRLRIKKSKA
jgi:hypothetical protein